MKKLILLVLVILFLPLAQGDLNPRETGKIKADITFTSEIKADPSVENINYSSYMLPATYKDLKVSTDYSVKEDKQGNKFLVLHWDDILNEDIIVRTTTTNSARFSSVKQVSYPYEVPEEKIKYLAQTNNTKISQEMKEKVKELVSGSKNSFEAVYKLSTWISDNIEYDISYGEEIKPAKFVFENKVGTCDEFTNLFISMAREAGLPTRYVAGIVYSKDGWGYHAWAEVYLGEWIPVDPTWNEVGWVDATHIPLGKFKDSSEVLGKITYVSEGGKVRVGYPDVSVNVREKEKLPEKFEIGSEFYPDKIGLDDYMIGEIEISSESCLGTNIKAISRRSSYGEILSFGIKDSKPEKEKSILVCSGEKEKVHFIFKSNKNLKQGYIYSNLADIYPFFGEKIVVDNKIDTREKGDSEIDLNLEKNVLKIGEKSKFNVDSEADYKIFSDLRINGNKVVGEEVGKHYIIAINEEGVLDRENITVKSSLDFLVSDIQVPEKVSCGENMTLNFTIQPFKPVDINIKPIVSSELSKIPSKNLHLNASENKSLNLRTSLKENCTGKDQYINMIVNDQRIFKNIEAVKPQPKKQPKEIPEGFSGNVFESIRQVLSNLVTTILESFRQIL